MRQSDASTDRNSDRRKPTSKRPKGGAPVGVLSDLDPVPASAVMYLRLWCEGHRDQLRADLTPMLGPEVATRVGQEFDHLCSLCIHHGRRRMCRHHLQCKCLGADESCFANLVDLAAAGEDADAMLIASLMLRAEQVPLSTALAQSVGAALSRAKNEEYFGEDHLTPHSGQIYPTPQLTQ